MPDPESHLTPDQFMANVEDWAPGPGLKESLRVRLAADGLPDDQAVGLSEAMNRCSEATFRYLKLIHRYATVQELNPRNFLPALAELVEHLQGLRDAGFEYAAAFLQYDGEARPGLKSDRFDTLYFDVIQGLDLKEYLKDVLEEVGPLLKAMSLASAELRGARLSELFEQCIRCQLYLRYYLMSENLRQEEETWSVLFDLNNLFAGEEPGSMEVLLEDLDEIREQLEKLKHMN